MDEVSETLANRIQLLMIGNSDHFDVDKRENLEVKFKQLK